MGAFLHEEDGNLAIVALNPTDEQQVLNLTLRHLSGPASLKTYRMSASESLKDLGAVAVADSRTTLQMTPLSIVTLSGESR